MFQALEAIFTVPPARPCSLLLLNSLLALDEKAPLVPLNAGLKPSQAIFVMYIFYHREKTHINMIAYLKLSIEPRARRSYLFFL